MWIESHQELGRHPKTKRLSRLLKLPLPHVVGMLHFLWWWALDYADDGDLGRYTDEDIAEAMLFEGEASGLIDSLLGAGAEGEPGFLERDEQGHLHIHDWEEYAGRLLEQRERSRRRAAEWRAERRTHTVHVRAESEPVANVATGPDRTGPNQTGPENHGSGAAAPAPAAPIEVSPEVLKAKKVRAEGAKPRAHPHLEQELALAEVLGIPIVDGLPDTSGLTAAEERQFYVAAAALGNAHRPRDDILEAGRRYWPNKTLTASALAAHISDLLRPAGPARTNGYRANGIKLPNGTSPATHYMSGGKTFNIDGPDPGEETGHAG